MVSGILGKKVGMTQIFDKRGNVIPVTIIQSGPCYVTQIKSIENCGYNAIQLGYSPLSTKHKKVTKPMLGHFEKANTSPFEYLKEYKVDNPLDHTFGQEFSVEIFKIGQKLNVSGLTIGKGNASNIKRNNFGRGPMSHGSKHHRLQGSLGAGTSPSRVFPGKKMPGRLGGKQQTIQNLEIVDINMEENLLVVKGSVPGKTGNIVNLSLQNI